MFELSCILDPRPLPCGRDPATAGRIARGRTGAGNDAARGAPGKNWLEARVRSPWRRGGDGPVMNFVNLLGMGSPLIVAGILLVRHFG